METNNLLKLSEKWDFVDSRTNVLSLMMSVLMTFMVVSSHVELGIMEIVHLTIVLFSMS